MAEDCESVANLAAPLQATEKELGAVAEDESVATSRASASSSRRFYFGIIVLVLVVLLWVGSSVLTQELYDDPDVDYEKPTALTTLCTATAAIFWIPRIFRCRSAHCREQVVDMLEQDNAVVPLRVALYITATWFFCQWTFNLSLARTALLTNTMLSSCSSAWTYMFGLVIGSARFSLFGVLCVVLGMSGSILAVVGSMGETKIDPDAPTDTYFGEALATASAMGYGVFSISLKKFVKPHQMPHLWGAVGVYSIFLGAVLMTICHFTGFETLHPPSGKALGIMLFNGFLGTSLSDFLWAQGVLLTSPLVATVCLNMTIPLSMIVDSVILKQHAFSWTSPIGACLVFCGVVAAGIDETRIASEQTNQQSLGSSPTQVGLFAEDLAAA